MNNIILEPQPGNEVAVDIYARLARNRVLFINDFIDDRVAASITAMLFLKEAENPHDKITIFLNSEGGDIRSVFMIYDVMKMLNSPIETICSGAAMNEVVLLLAAGSKGLRAATSHSIISPSQLFHSGSYLANLVDAKSIMERSKLDNKNFMSILAKCSGNTYSKVMKDFDRKKFFTAKQALNYGFIDSILGE